MSDNTFTCAACGGKFEKGRTDEEALEESRAKFGKRPPEDLVEICGECYDKAIKREREFLETVTEGNC